MGRSVSYPHNSLVCFFHNDDEGQWIVEDFRNWCWQTFPSVYEADRWLSNEDHVLVENGHAEFGLSEYCGLWAAWILPKNDSGICHHWCAIALDKLRLGWEQLRPVAIASNGEVLYERTTDGD